MDSYEQIVTSARLTSMGSADFSAQLVLLRNGVVLDVTASSYNTFGHRECGQVTARLTLNQAIELERLIGDTISAACEVPDPRQMALWGSRRTDRGAAT
jgi:hypothetical protein